VAVIVVRMGTMVSNVAERSADIKVRGERTMKH